MHSTLSNEEVAERGREIYQQEIYAQVESGGNIGKHNFLDRNRFC